MIGFIILLILFKSTLISQNEKHWGNAFQNTERITSDGKISNISPIIIKVEGFYGMQSDKNGDYHLTLSNSKQTLIKLEGTIDKKEGHHRVTWKTDKTYRWSNGMITDEFKVVNPASYSKEGKVYTMFGPLPEMKGTSVLITATYGPYEDSIIIHLH